MIALIGLGNPGEKYQNNRHNAGKLFVEYILEKTQNSKLKTQSHNAKLKSSEIVEVNLSKEELLLVKSTIYMNQSGTAVKEFIVNCKLKIENLVVIHDDLDIPLGKFKIQKGRGPELHNGIDSVEKSLGTKNFWRIRIGVDNRTPDKRIDGETYVLQDFTKEEFKTLQTVFQTIFEKIGVDKNFSFIHNK